MRRSTRIRNNRLQVFASLSSDSVPSNVIQNSNNDIESPALQPMENSSGTSNSVEWNGNITVSPNIFSNLSNNECQRNILIKKLRENKLDCVICLDVIERVNFVWSCRTCFNIMHLKCIKIHYIKTKKGIIWRCPTCRNETFGKPSYICFCRASSYPFPSSFMNPHSCGKKCGKHYNKCQHTCQQMCHPGPCPICIAIVVRNCMCGKSRAFDHCGQPIPYLCNNCPGPSKN